MTTARTSAGSAVWAPGGEDAFDVVVVGSGCAGLTAALAAALGGASVLVVEKSDRLGGTSAMSGAGTWVPANDRAAAAGHDDTVDEAYAYLAAASPEGWAATEGPLWRSYLAAGPEMLRLVERHTPLDFELVPEPDPMAEHPGGKRIGRMLSPQALSLRRLGALRRRLRPSTLPHMFTYREMTSEPLYTRPVGTVLRLLPRLARRLLRGERGQGSALVGGLLMGCVDAGCRFAVETPVADLLRRPDGSVSGVRLCRGGESSDVAARRGVVLATGGFEWDEETFARHFPEGAQRVGSPRSNTGDGQRMAAAAGARLDRMDQANVYPCLPTRYEGRLHGMPMTFQAAPHAIVVNADAKRFADEYDYNFGEALDRRDPATGRAVNLPAWLVADSRFLSASLPFRWYARRDPGWVRRAGTLEGLARSIGLPPDALARTVARFNDFCAWAHDEDFGRGDGVWGRYKAKRKDGETANPALKPIVRPPFVAMELGRMVLGTKGGARTDDGGRVLREDGSVVAGLYAAGNAMANPIGTRALGAGTTIGPCMTWGYICARTILSSNRDG